MIEIVGNCTTLQKIGTQLRKLGTNKPFLAAAALLLMASFASAQETGRTPTTDEPAVQADSSSAGEAIVKHLGTVITPESSVARPEDAGLRAHTNHVIFVPAGSHSLTVNPDTTFFETPASLGCVYKVGPAYAGCVPNFNTPLSHPTGGWGAIALVNAFDNPNAAVDLAVFSAHFGLPVANFSKVYANQAFNPAASCVGVPAGNMGWGLEEDLDIQWAHAMAPSAKIILVEACSNSFNDLLIAEDMAAAQVNAAGGGDISNSWGAGEFAGETANDKHFHVTGWKHITYFVSAGDTGVGAAYPSSSPWVVSAGGTTVNRLANGNFSNESCWAGSGGGISGQELWQSPPAIANGMGPWSNFQYELFGGQPFVTAPRKTPDFSFDADPASGVYVYDTFEPSPGWYAVGGTSVSSPALAGIVNLSNNRLGQAPPGGGYYHTGENDLLYSQLFSTTAYTRNFYDVTVGSNGAGSNAGPGYDTCTGVGTPRGLLGK